MIDWLEQYALTCPSKYFFGVDCPGCGMQRSFIALLKGNFMESFILYPALLPMLFMVWLLIVHLVFKLNKGAKYLQYTFIFTASVVMINFIVRLIIR